VLLLCWILKEEDYCYCMWSHALNVVVRLDTSVCPSVCLPVCLFVCLSVKLSLSVCLSAVCLLSVCLLNCLHMSINNCIILFIGSGHVFTFGNGINVSPTFHTVIHQGSLWLFVLHY
jgi:hypothetical protein